MSTMAAVLTCTECNENLDTGAGWTESPLDKWVTGPGYLIQWKGFRLNLLFPPLHTLLPFNVVYFRRRPSGFIANAIIKCITHEHRYCTPVCVCVRHWGSEGYFILKPQSALVKTPVRRPSQSPSCWLCGSRWWFEGGTKNLTVHRSEEKPSIFISATLCLRSVMQSLNNPTLKYFGQ